MGSEVVIWEDCYWSNVGEHIISLYGLTEPDGVREGRWRREQHVIENTSNKGI